MDKEILDRLLMDRALGALEPDVEALLEHYLAQHPDDSVRCRETEDLVSLSRDLLRSTPPQSLPAMTSVPLRRMKRLQPLGIAAALLVCFMMGRKFAGVQLDPVVPHPVVAVSGLEHPKESLSGIWSLRRETVQVRRPERSSRWKWTSPVRQPELLKQGE